MSWYWNRHTQLKPSLILAQTICPGKTCFVWNRWPAIPLTPESSLDSSDGPVIIKELDLVIVDVFDYDSWAILELSTSCEVSRASIDVPERQ